MSNEESSPSQPSAELSTLVHGEPGQQTTTSLLVAEKFGKRHADVLRRVKELDCSPEFAQRNFAFGSSPDAQGQLRPMVEMTRDGFSFLVMGFTGKEAAVWKERFIEAFNLAAQAVALPAPVPENLPVLANPMQPVLEQLVTVHSAQIATKDAQMAELLSQQARLIALIEQRPAAVAPVAAALPPPVPSFGHVTVAGWLAQHYPQHTKGQKYRLITLVDADYISHGKPIKRTRNGFGLYSPARIAKSAERVFGAQKEMRF